MAAWRQVGLDSGIKMANTVIDGTTCGAIALHPTGRKEAVFAEDGRTDRGSSWGRSAFLHAEAGDVICAIRDSGDSGVAHVEGVNTADTDDVAGGGSRAVVIGAALDGGGSAAGSAAGAVGRGADSGEPVREGKLERAEVGEEATVV